MKTHRIPLTRAAHPAPWLLLTVGLVLPLLSAPGQTNVAGGLDPSFNLGTGTDGDVEAVCRQPDNRILIAGNFTSVHGAASAKVARLLADGRVDATFDPGTGPNGSVLSLAVQADGKILAAGDFSRYHGIRCPGLARLHPDGAHDAGFDVTPWLPEDLHVLERVLVQPDGRIVVGGRRSQSYGPWSTVLRRFNPDGSQDPTFDWGSFPEGEWSHIIDLALQPDGKIIVAGDFASQPTPGLVRLNANGSVDGSFAPALTVRTGNPDLGPLLLQPDGKVLVVGQFDFGSGFKDRVVRLNADGSVDTSWVHSPGLDGQYSYIATIALQPDGKVLAGGSFTGYHGTPRNRLVRLASDGTVDPTFDAGANLDGINALLAQPDGNLLVGCYVGASSDEGFRGIGRLQGQMPPVIVVQPQSLTAQLHTTNQFEVTALGAAPLQYQWRKHGVELPAPHTNAILALLAVQPTDAGNYVAVVSNPYGFATSQVASLSVTSVSTRPIISQHPADQSAVIGGRAAFSVLAGGTAPLRYQWLFNEQPIAGGTTASLTLDTVRTNDAGDYRVTVFNPAGGQTSQVARLTVLVSPQITVRQSVHRVAPGQNVELVIELEGTAPLNCQWYRNGQALTGATATRLVLANVTPVSGGVYTARAWNGAGLAVSPPILVQVGVPGGVDFTFQADAIRGTVSELLLQPDGKVLVSGSYGLTIDGETWNDHVARLNADGSLDPGFDTGCAIAYCCETCNGDLVALQPDGKVLVYGSKIDFGRLHPDGAVDPAFAPTSYGLGYSGSAVQPDGRILVAKYESHYPNPSTVRIVRLLPDGSEETGFQPPLIGVADWQTDYAFAVQPDGTILVGGWMNVDSTGEFAGLVRLQSDGSRDENFPSASPDDWVKHIVLQPDGRILIAGDFTEVGGWPRPGLARLHPDGSLDASFVPFWATQPLIHDLALQANGRILLAAGDGDSESGGVGDGGLVRLNADGSLDPTFAPSDLSLGSVIQIVVQPDGAILIAGSFTQVNGVALASVARIFGDLPPSPSFVERESTSQFYVPGGLSCEIQLRAQPATDVSVYAVEDQPPPGWSVSLISDAGAFDPVTGKVKFGPFNDSVWRTLSYHVTPPSDATGVRCFAGTGSADGINTPILGTSCLLPLLTHPADTQPPQWSIGIGEITAYGAAWRRGSNWSVAPNPIPIDYVTRAAYLWRGGECYDFDATVTNAPLWWVTCGPSSSADFQSAVSQVFNLQAAQRNANVPEAGEPPAAFKPAFPSGATLRDRVPPTTARHLPPGYVPGAPVPVTIVSTPGGASGWAIEEHVPAGWSVSQISDGGEWDVANASIQWGPFLDSAARTLRYQLAPPPHARGSVALLGVGSYDGTSVPTGGATALPEACRLSLAPPPTSGAFGVLVHGRPEARIIVEASSDLLEWETVLTAPLATDGWTLLELASSPKPHRFFRARVIE